SRRGHSPDRQPSRGRNHLRGGRRAGGVRGASRRDRAYPSRRRLSDRRKHFIVLGCVLAALVGVALLAVPGSPAHRKLTLGLDLHGGLEVVLKAVPPKNHKLTSDDL